ncbi:DUF397 domain-containing protein [Streptomyces sp. 549]|uniref:DUF397 domain-containing protein n=1 Tax=Streptomyces sp. 549 TaxID=3049076 RepID=UPI0024C2D32F|nr:DUF397 domain-containing protein [Streptomyces sp. 549]MDK1473069.1 DUF397 domain-containing protein [Streptomyces sp. 549]
MRTHHDGSAGEWRASSYSDGSGGNCLQVRDDLTGEAVPVRDSKDPGRGTLTVPAPEWTAFVTAVKTGVLNGS